MNDIVRLNAKYDAYNAVRGQYLEFILVASVKCNKKFDLTVMKPSQNNPYNTLWTTIFWRILVAFFSSENTMLHLSMHSINSLHVQSKSTNARYFDT